MTDPTLIERLKQWLDAGGPTDGSADLIRAAITALSSPPSLDLRAVVARWRTSQAKASSNHNYHDASIWGICADDLDAALKESR